MTTCPPYTGLYINLDRSVERRKKIEDQLRSFDLASRYERFAAVDARDFSVAHVYAGEGVADLDRERTAAEVVADFARALPGPTG